MYVVGAPLFGRLLQEPETERKRFFVTPIGQVNLSRKVLVQAPDRETAFDRICEEYMAIVLSLRNMGIDVAIIVCREQEIDHRIVTICQKELGCKLVGFHSGYPTSFLIYPRDFCTVLPTIKLILVNDKAATVKPLEKDGYYLLSSPYGEGGRVLSCGNTILISERLILKSSRSVSPRGRGLREIRKRGMKIGLIPPFLSLFFTKTKVTNRFFFNDHLDRVACLLRGKNGNLHLIIAQDTYFIDWKGKGKPPWVPLYPKEWIEKIQKVCQPMGIRVHLPRLEIPYSLNLVQFPDNRVLMTDGDEAVSSIIRKIVGKENLFKTPIPIRVLPLWANAGLRCLVNRAPMPLFG